MVRMRIPIREQLGLLVLLSSLVGLAVISIATWITNHSFVLSIRATRLSLTASLKAAQLSSNLLLLQSSVRSTGTRVLIQSALERFNDGNNSEANWTRSEADLVAVFQGDRSSTLLLQARIFPVNSSEHSVMNATAEAAKGIVLPYRTPSGQDATMGDPIYGFAPALYPAFTTKQVPVNSTFNTTVANFQGHDIDADNFLILGPYPVNESLSLLSITVPIINNTSAIDVLGWLTGIVDAQLIRDVVQAEEGLDESGLTMIFAPNNATNKFADGVVLNPNPSEAESNQTVRFLMPPTQRANIRNRHTRYNMTFNSPPLNWSRFPAVQKGFTKQTIATNNAGSIISTRDEDGKHVAVGYALVNSKFVDWLVLVEQSHTEVWGPIFKLRNIIIACVFGTMGGMILLAFPLAHYFSRPIRRLRDATKKSVAPPGYLDHDSLGGPGDDENDEAEDVARKEGWLDSVKHFGRRRKTSRAERKEEDRRRQFRIPGKVKDRKHLIHDELTDLTKTFNEMTDELMMQYEKLEERVAQRTAELEQSKKAAEAANESKTLFIANISHELKTPLNGILGMCAVCMSEDDPVKLKRSLGIIYKSGDLLLNLLTDLLTFSKNQVGQHLSLDEKEFRLRDISSQILAIFERQAKESEIDLRVKFEGPYESNLDDQGRPLERADYGPFGLGRVKDMILYGDQHRILQVVINLVSNSLKFTPQGGSVLITIRCVGEASIADSRKASLQSRQSSVRNSRVRTRASSSEGGSVTISHPNHFDTANSINPLDKPTPFSHMFIQDRAATPPPGRWLQFEFEVEDTGPGIPEALQSKIFEPFVQGDLGLSKKFGGTGLGLSICSQLADLMKGTIVLKSEVGHGSVFTMHIPLKHLTSRADSTASSSNVNLGEMQGRRSASLEEPRKRAGSGDDARSGRSIQSAVSAPAGGTVVPFENDSKPRLVGLSQPFFASNPPLDSPSSQSAAMERVTAEATKRGDKVRVLVAEDNKTNQEVVLRMLKLEDVYDVTVAKDGQEALDRVKESMERKTPYNLIFMDVQMPNLDGLQSTRLIRQQGFSAPIVALSAYAEEQNVKECLDSGMNFFLSKPIRRPALKHVLKTYCPPIPEEEAEGSTTPPASERGKANGGIDGAPSPSQSSSQKSDSTLRPGPSAPGPGAPETPDISPLS